MQPTTIAVDLAKSVFEIAVSRFPGKVAERHRLSRAKFLRFFAQRQPSHPQMKPDPGNNASTETVVCDRTRLQ